MKNKLTRILAALLIAMMLIPTFATFAVSAEGETGETGETTETVDISDIVNVYELNKLNAAPPNGSGVSMNDEPVDEGGVLASKPFELTHETDGDRYIYVGPCPEPTNANYNNLIAYWYKKDGTSGGSPKKIGELMGDVANGGSVVDRFEDGSVILRIKFGKIGGSYAKYAALKVPTTYADFMLVTVEQPFTKDDYYAYADAQGWDIESVGLRPVLADEAPEGYEGLWNLFPLGEDFAAPSTQKEATNVYTLSDYIPVKAGDIITMGAISTKESESILYAYSDESFDSNYKEIKRYKKFDVGIEFVENIGYDYAIYSYTVPEGVSFVKVSAPVSLYSNGDLLVTRNQLFKGAELRETLEIPELSTDAKAHAFNGKNALFVGDSISNGDYDTPASYRNPTTSFARRLALATGLIPTVVSASGATIGKTGKTNVKWEWDLLKTALLSKKNYDMVIIQGGINDARQNVDVGDALPANTDREVLVEKERTATFAGGLQLIFNDATDKWPEAELYYIADYKVSADVTDKDMSAYYAQAKALCAAYGVHFIDLYNDTELYETFDYENAELFADDKFTPTSATYDLLFPTVLRLFNETLENKDDDEPIIPDDPEVTTPEEPEETTSPEPEVTTPEPEETTTPEPEVITPVPEPEETTITPVETTTPDEMPTPDTGDNAEEEEHVCEEVSGWKAFWNSIMNFFRRLFGQPELCDCGDTIKKKK